MESNKIYFSFYQANQSTIKNLGRRLTWQKTLIKLMEQNGLEYGTITAATGIYKATREPSFILEIMASDSKQSNQVHDLCQDIKTAFCQDSVMLTTPSDTLFI